jgi:hypothetical protein
MPREYVHRELGRECAAPAGYYTLTRELRLKHNGNEVLAITGVGELECSCCAGESVVAGRGGMYAIVPGYVRSWQSRENAEGLPVSDVEPITDHKVRRDIARTIIDSEGIANIDVW